MGKKSTRQLSTKNKEQVLVYLDDMRKRFWGLAGVNVVVVFGSMFGLWTFTLRQAESAATVAAMSASTTALESIERRKTTLHESLDKTFQKVGEIVEKNRSKLEAKQQETIDCLSTRVREAVDETDRIRDELKSLLGAKGLAELGKPGVAAALKELLVWAKKKNLINEVQAVKRLQPPIGSIIAWHKNPYTKDSTFSLGKRPDGWRECNGDDLTRDKFPELFKKLRLPSTVNSFKLPNLNKSDGDKFLGNKGGGAFLRGGTTSGRHQDDAFQGHGHHFSYHSDSDGAGGPSNVVKLPNHKFNQPGRDDVVKSPVKHLEFGEVRVDRETRPVNMSVVWIMRVK